MRANQNEGVKNHKRSNDDAFRKQLAK
jgi:hypothetical protein